MVYLGLPFENGDFPLRTVKKPEGDSILNKYLLVMNGNEPWLRDQQT